MKLRLVLEHDPETKRWAAFFPELPWCASAGDTEKEAVRNAKESLELWFEPSAGAVPAGAKVLQVALAGTAPADGSNQSSKASLALRTASSSVSPAEAHPGSSGKKAAHRLVSGSCSNTNRSFMQERIIHAESCSNLEFSGGDFT